MIIIMLCVLLNEERDFFINCKKLKFGRRWMNTRVENPGRRVKNVFQKNLSRGSTMLWKFSRGSSIFCIIVIYWQVFWKLSRGGRVLTSHYPSKQRNIINYKLIMYFFPYSSLIIDFIQVIISLPHSR